MSSVYTHPDKETEIDAVFTKYGFARPYVDYGDAVTDTIALAADRVKKALNSTI